MRAADPGQPLLQRPGAAPGLYSGRKFLLISETAGKLEAAPAAGTVHNTAVQACHPIGSDVGAAAERTLPAVKTALSRRSRFCHADDFLG